MSRLCVIPARGGSKRIPGKNVRDFAGRPMLTHALKAAQDSRLFDHIHVSTDDDQIADAAAAAGAPPVFLRDPALADDHTPIRDVVTSDLARFTSGEGGVISRTGPFTSITLVYATAVLIEAGDLVEAIKVYEKQPDRPLLAVVDVGAPLERLMEDRQGVLRPALPDQFANRTQDLTRAYRDAGAFAIYSAATLEADRDGAAALEFRPFVLPRWKGVDIDTEEDWRFAELIKAGLTALEGAANP
ncbi:MAG: pseudaminic acid cytidylyltransferase [Alphaproteobacteria bacterium]|nr:pseudaminic acid cytidylyltransferase [Alphaproteobacteria bacterium]